MSSIHNRVDVTRVYLGCLTNHPHEQGLIDKINKKAYEYAVCLTNHPHEQGLIGTSRGMTTAEAIVSQTIPMSRA